MASTNKTTHYELSQYTANDKPTYLVDYNGDMSKIDTGIYEADTLAKTNESAIGTMSNLNTTDKSSLVGAINEVNTQVGTNTGNISTLNTSVSANTGNIGTMVNLTTSDKTSLVNATNEVNGKIGDLSNLNTTVKTSIVNAINELEEVEEYVTAETHVGKWINGKPVYRKIIQDTTANSENTWKALNLTNVDTVLSYSGELIASNETFLVPYGAGSRNIWFKLQNNTLHEAHDSSYFNSANLTLIIVYTKTTD